MTESGLGGNWFRAAVAGKDERNAIFIERIQTSPHNAMYGEAKDVSRFRAFGCKAFVLFIERIKTSPHNAMYGEPKDVS